MQRLSFAICVAIMIVFLIYELFTLSQRSNDDLKYYDLDPLWRQKVGHQFQLNAAPNPPPPDSHLPDEIISKLQSKKVRPSGLETNRVAVSSLSDQSLVEYTALTLPEECEAATLPDFNYFNHLIDAESIEYIFPSADDELYGLLHSDAFLSHWDRSFLPDAFWESLSAIDTDSSDDIEGLRARFDRYKAFRENGEGPIKDDGEAEGRRKGEIRKFFDFNGLSSDLALFHRNVESIGRNGDYWLSSDSCTQRKSCDIYPINRVLTASTQISCQSILTELMPPIYDCIAAKGEECEAFIDSGYYRVILKAKWPETGQDVVIKVMKPSSIKKDRDLLRHIRESILLQRLSSLERDAMSSADTETFTQSLGGVDSQRAFNFVEEMGHCVTPLWISVSMLYKMPLDKWILGGYAKKAELRQLIFMALQIAQSVHLLHSLPGGPFHHTDIQPRQFLLDDRDRVYINDFNRGKFQPFFFGNGRVERCWYCGHRSRGHWRAPEEPVKRPLNEKLDVFSLGLTIWALFANDVPFKDATFDDLPFIYFEQRRIPPMTPNMPPAIKQVIWSALKFEPRERATAKEIESALHRIYHHDLESVTEGFHRHKSGELTAAEMWTETNYPPLSKRDTLPH